MLGRVSDEALSALTHVFDAQINTYSWLRYFAGGLASGSTASKNFVGRTDRCVDATQKVNNDEENEESDITRHVGDHRIDIRMLENF